MSRLYSIFLLTMGGFIFAGFLSTIAERILRSVPVGLLLREVFRWLLLRPTGVFLGRRGDVLAGGLGTTQTFLEILGEEVDDSGEFFDQVEFEDAVVASRQADRLP